MVLGVETVVDTIDGLEVIKSVCGVVAKNGLTWTVLAPSSAFFGPTIMSQPIDAGEEAHLKIEFLAAP